MASRDLGVQRYFYSSTACVYNTERQNTPDSAPLKESDAYPASPEDGYGWEKLFSERLCKHFHDEHGLYVRVARFYNSYGPLGTWKGGREKAPAALCRKVIEAKYGNGTIDIWGNGEQTRSFMYIDDNIDGILKIMESDIDKPINLGSSEQVTINGLLDIIEGFAGTKVKRRYQPDKPQGVQGRNSDNTMIRDRLGWEPATPLKAGLTVTYEWNAGQFLKEHNRRCLLGAFIPAHKYAAGNTAGTIDFCAAHIPQQFNTQLCAQYGFRRVIGFPVAAIGKIAWLQAL
jgi:nucleoside-diphosphate-sugar epimerase